MLFIKYVLRIPLRMTDAELEGGDSLFVGVSQHMLYCKSDRQ
jgi:hypothetical protein